MKRGTLCAISATLLIAGCAETQFAREEKSAERQIDVAKDEGASKEALEAARGSLEFARESEARATADLDGGREDLKKAQDRREVARAVAGEKRRAAERTDAKLTAARQDLLSANAREDDLRSKGVSETDVSAASRVEMSRARYKFASMKAARETVHLEIPLADLEFEAAETAIKAAETRIGSAEQRLSVARSLYARAEQQAKGVEIEAIAEKRAAIDTRLDRD